MDDERAPNTNPNAIEPNNMNARCLAACLLLSIPTLAWGQVAALPTVDDFREGEQWTWRRVDEATNVETSTSWRRSVVEDDEQVFLTSSKRLFTIDQVYLGLGWREWPLQVGKTWEFATTWSAPNGDPGTTIEHAEVVAYESVTVPAGKFMAFRIEYKGHWDVTDSASRHRTGDVADTYWYAPDVKADVKHRFVSSGKYGSEQWLIELTNYFRPKN
jgi:hypothetical protein